MISPWDLSQYQTPRAFRRKRAFSTCISKFAPLAMLFTIRLDTAAEETWVRGQFSLYREWYGRLMYNTCPIPTETPRLNLFS